MPGRTLGRPHSPEGRLASGKMEILLCSLWTPGTSPAQTLHCEGRRVLTPSEDQQGCQDQVGSSPSSCCCPEFQVLPPCLRAQGLGAPQLHGTEVAWWLGHLLLLFLFLLRAPLLGAFHMLVDGLRRSWGQPFLWGSGGHEIGKRSVGGREGSGKNRVRDFGVPHEHKARKRVLRVRLEGRY